MRVLIVCSSNVDQASGRHALWHAEELARAGNPTLVSLYGDPEALRLEDSPLPPGVSAVWHRFRMRSIDRDALVAVKLFEPVLIHAWNPRVPTIVASKRYQRATSAPVFVHWEDDEWTLMNGVPGRPLARAVGLRGRKLLAHAFPSQGGAFSDHRTLAWISEHAAGLDALTPALASETGNRFGRECAALLPVSPERLMPEAASNIELPLALNGEAIIAYTGSIGPASIGDLHTSVRALAELQRRGHSVVLIHSGPVLPRYDLGELKRSAGVRPGTVAFLGYVPFSQMLALLQRADVLIQPGAPSRFNRLRLPSKLQAYLASGTPTVMFAVGIGEMLVDREEVLKLHTDDPVELADRIAEVLHDQQLREELSAGGPEASRRLFDPAVNIARLLDHYRAGLAR